MQESSCPQVAAQVLSEATHLAIPSLPHWIEPTVEYLRQKAILCGVCHESRAGKVMVGLVEALANAIIHGNLQVSSALKESGDDAFARALAERAADPVLSARLVDIRIHYDGNACRWIITDEGAGFDVKRVIDRCLSDDPEAMLASGRGILMMHSFLDAVEYQDNGRRLILTLNRPSGAEKRRRPRLPVHETMRVAPMTANGRPDEAAATDAVSHDLSETGVALVQSGLAEGQRIFVGIPSADRIAYVPAVVRHCRTVTAGHVQLGCEFDFAAPAVAEVATAEQADAMQRAIGDLLAQHKAPLLPEDERRAHQRAAFNKVVSIEIRDGAPITAYARDMSYGGMAVIARVGVALGPVVVALPGADKGSLRIRAHVVRCNRIEEGYHDVGLRFVRLHAP